MRTAYGRDLQDQVSRFWATERSVPRRRDILARQRTPSAPSSMWEEGISSMWDETRWKLKAAKAPGDLSEHINVKEGQWFSWQ